MKILLTSSGLIGNSLERHFWSLIEYKKNIRIAIIPTAADPIVWVPENR